MALTKSHLRPARPALLAVAMMAAFTVPTMAGDLSNRGPGGLKSSNSAVPVPAPVPYEEHFKYYFGGSVGWTAFANGKNSLTADHQIPGQPALLMRNADDMLGPAVVSVIAGRYITPSLRAELNYDYRTPQRPARNATQTYNGRNVGTMDVAHPTTGVITSSTQTNFYNMSRTEDVTVQNHTFMLNAYFDLNRGGKITPYIGAGVGFTRRDVTRDSTERVGACYGGTNSVIGNTAGCVIGGSLVNESGAVHQNTDEKTGFGLAASLMAGASVALSPRTHWDIGYRMMYHGGKVGVISSALNGISLLEVGDRIDHEVRTGLRFDIW